MNSSFIGYVHPYVYYLQPKQNKDLINQVARLADTVTVSMNKYTFSIQWMVCIQDNYSVLYTQQ